MFPVQSVTLSWSTLKDRIITPVVVQNKRAVTKVHALWDTGSNKTFISNRVVTVLGLEECGHKVTETSGGNIHSSLYDINLYLSDMIIFRVRAASYPDTVSEADVVVGMDIINQGDFAITNLNGQTTFTFRTPSQTKIQYSDYNITDKEMDELVEILSTC